MGMDNQKSHVSWGVIFGVVSVWFGAHAGGGFASGSQTMNFFVKYGWPGCFYTGTGHGYSGPGLPGDHYHV